MKTFNFELPIRGAQPVRALSIEEKLEQASVKMAAAAALKPRGR